MAIIWLRKNQYAARVVRVLTGIHREFIRKEIMETKMNINKLIDNMKIKLGFLEKDLDKIEKTLEEEK